MTTPDITKIKREMREAAKAAMFNGKPVHSLNNISPANVLSLLADHDALARQGLDPAGGAAAMREAAGSAMNEHESSVDKAFSPSGEDNRETTASRRGAIAMRLAAARLVLAKKGTLGSVNLAEEIMGLPIPAAPPSAPGDALQRAREALEFIRDEGFIEESAWHVEQALAALDALPSAPIRSEAEIRAEIERLRVDYDNAAFGGIEYTCGVLAARIAALEWVLTPPKPEDKEPMR